MNSTVHYELVMEQELVSIIIPVYNSGIYLVRCLDSILKQSYSNIEIIIVDDCSNDNSRDIIDNYVKKYPNILSYVHDKNKGPGAARNTGISMANGKYITFVDSDDEIMPDYCQELVKLMNDADIAVAGRATYVEEKYTKSKTAPKIETIDKTTALQYVLMGKYSAHPVWGKMYKREIISKLMFDEEYYFEDIRYSIDSMMLSEKVCFSDKDLYLYKMRQGSIMTSNIEMQINSYTQAALYVYKQLIEKDRYMECEYAFKIFLARGIIRNTRLFCRGNISEEVYKKYAAILVNLMESIGGL